MYRSHAPGGKKSHFKGSSPYSRRPRLTPRASPDRAAWVAHGRRTNHPFCSLRDSGSLRDQQLRDGAAGWCTAVEEAPRPAARPGGRGGQVPGNLRWRCVLHPPAHRRPEKPPTPHCTARPHSPSPGRPRLPPVGLSVAPAQPVARLRSPAKKPRRALC